MSDEKLQRIIKRLERLEKAVFGSARKKSTKQPPTAEDFEGPSGGVRMLMSRDYFKTKRSLADVRTALAKNDYH